MLFPRSEVRLFYWVFFFIGTIEVGSILMILGKMVVWDNIITMHLASNAMERSVAYEAHLAGYLFGFLAAILMLAIGALPRDVFDILALWSRYRRRASSLRSSRPTACARCRWRGQPQGGGAGAVAAFEPPAPRTPADDLRDQIVRAIDEFRLPDAARLYRELLKLDPDYTLGRSQRLDVANQLTAEGDFEMAAQAYERYLRKHPHGAMAQHVRFLSGVIYARRRACRRTGRRRNASRRATAT